MLHCSLSSSAVCFPVFQRVSKYEQRLECFQFHSAGTQVQGASADINFIPLSVFFKSVLLSSILLLSCCFTQQTFPLPNSSVRDITWPPPPLQRQTLRLHSHHTGRTLVDSPPQRSSSDAVCSHRVLNVCRSRPNQPSVAVGHAVDLS